MAAVLGKIKAVQAAAILFHTTALPLLIVHQRVLGLGKPGLGGKTIDKQRGDMGGSRTTGGVDYFNPVATTQQQAAHCGSDKPGPLTLQVDHNFFEQIERENREKDNCLDQFELPSFPQMFAKKMTEFKADPRWRQ
jgi:hypothetical protein